MATTGWKETGSYREYPYRNTPHPKEKVEPYGFVKNQRFYKKAYTDGKLTPTSLALLGYITAHCDTNGECFLSLSKIGEEQGVSRQAIQNRINPLMREGYVIREREYTSLGGCLCNTYRLNFDHLKEDVCAELTEVSCPPATLLSGGSATSGACDPATQSGCTKKPFKKPLEECSAEELHEILKEVREAVFVDMPKTEAAKIESGVRQRAAPTQSERGNLIFQIGELIKFGQSRGITI